MLYVIDVTHKNLICIKIDGVLKKSDYDILVPIVDQIVKEHGKIRMFIFVDNIDGIKPEALKKDIAAYFKHYNSFEKIAVVGCSKWEKLWTKISSPFVSGSVKYFPNHKTVEAQQWILG
jgi:hypothetical protein